MIASFALYVLIRFAFKFVLLCTLFNNLVFLLCLMFVLLFWHIIVILDLCCKFTFSFPFLISYLIFMHFFGLIFYRDFINYSK
jgi:hypothetical protein